MFCQTLFFRSSLLLNGSIVPQSSTSPTISDDLCLLFCIYHSSMALLVCFLLLECTYMYTVSVQCVFRFRAVACARWASRRRLEQPSLPNFIVYFSLKAYYIPTHRRQGMTPRIPSSRTATQKKSGGKKKLCY